MNEKFFSLPEEKQKAILNAGYRVFSRTSYKKSPMSEIASAAGISKSLLFYYFHNKKELYLFLWENCPRITMEYLQKYNCCGQTDFFETMLCGLRAKVSLMKRYPDLAAFAVKAYYETDPAVCQEIQKNAIKSLSFKANEKLLRLDPEQFVPGLDLNMMWQDMYWASEGYLWEKFQKGTLDADEVERDFVRMINFWKQIYLRKEEG